MEFKVKVFPEMAVTVPDVPRSGLFPWGIPVPVLVGTLVAGTLVVVCAAGELVVVVAEVDEQAAVNIIENARIVNADPQSSWRRNLNIAEILRTAFAAGLFFLSLPIISIKY